MLAITMKSRAEGPAVQPEWREPSDADARQLANITEAAMATRASGRLDKFQSNFIRLYNLPLTTNTSNTINTNPRPPLG
jgi:hypothetical protein